MQLDDLQSFTQAKTKLTKACRSAPNTPRAPSLLIDDTRAHSYDFQSELRHVALADACIYLKFFTVLSVLDFLRAIPAFLYGAGLAGKALRSHPSR